jgi:hypothetical protein
MMAGNQTPYYPNSTITDEAYGQVGRKQLSTWKAVYIVLTLIMLTYVHAVAYSTAVTLDHTSQYTFCITSTKAAKTIHVVFETTHYITL